MRERGHAAVELALAVGLLLLPTAIAVLGFGPWSERRVLVEAMAAGATRAAVIALDTRVGERVVAEMAADYGLTPELVRLGWCGSAPGPSTGSCPLTRGSVVAAEVEVWVPLVATPWGDIGGVWIGAVHVEAIDLYRSMG